MSEPITTVGLGAIAAYLGKDGIEKLLGPTAGYLGGEIEEFTRKRIENIGTIFKKAADRLGSRIDQPGSVPPKVLKTVINEGSYADDQIAVEYFGGVLASSRTSISRDDRGARIAKKLDGLSSYQIRCHYLIYSTISSLFRERGASFAQHKDRERLQIFMPMESFVSAMGFTQEEFDNPQLLTHIFHGLGSDDLISTHWAFGSEDILKTISHGAAIAGPGVLCTPTASGAELFLWGFGGGSHDLSHIFSPDFSSEISGVPSSVSGSRAVRT